MLFKFCRKKKHETKPGEILDQVISQSSSTANQCLLYKLANYKRGGAFDLFFFNPVNDIKPYLPIEVYLQYTTKYNSIY